MNIFVWLASFLICFCEHRCGGAKPILFLVGVEFSPHCCVCHLPDISKNKYIIIRQNGKFTTLNRQFWYVSQGDTHNGISLRSPYIGTLRVARVLIGCMSSGVSVPFPSPSTSSLLPGTFFELSSPLFLSS